MGQAKQRGSRAERIEQALTRAEREPNLAATMIAPNRADLARRIIPVYQEMDAKLAESPAHIDCEAGCSHCCYYHVLITPAEAFALAAFIEALPAAELESIQARLTATAAHVAPLSQNEYITTNIPCAFLDSGRCTVYSMRPNACRGFHSRDVAVCKRAFDNPRSVEPHAYDQNRQLITLHYKRDWGIAQLRAGCEAAEYEMHGAVLSALTDPSAFNRWKQGAVTFPTVHDRTPL
ncbi:YkgJ family cysteine cluster protein [Burkholderia metallica]|uniref:YkgJ family cysteine cluster protein n=1 Tax=Burkholderia metallica TaxID=488729 RepID=UPI00157AFA89|nr:YkgJ family cysteine cluster protein [Burkholderia metallica]NTZ86224.1 YkgJ family cysteine cluster protein [Burkholderia metallica]